MTLPIDRLEQTLRKTGVSRFMEHFETLFPETHLKDLVVDAVGPGREIVINGRRVVNFGCDSFLGLDQHPRLIEAIETSVRHWGTHNGSSRIFASVRANVQAEEILAQWLGTEATLIYPSVTLANLGAIPGLVGKADVIVYDEFAHNSIQEGIRIAKANGTRSAMFRHNDPADLERQLHALRPYRFALIAVDGVYSMTGDLPPLRDFQAIALQHDAVLYIDDAHGTGVLGEHGRGTVLESLGSYDNTLVVGSLSKGFSCLGGFIGCSRSFQRQLKIRSNSYIFGGPVPPPYLDAIITATEILLSSEYPLLRARLKTYVDRLTTGCREMGLTVLGGATPIVSVFIGDEADTLQVGKLLFDAGYYVQSVTFPAVPYHGGVIRIQVNANHTSAQIEGLLDALGETMTTLLARSSRRAA